MHDPHSHHSPTTLDEVRRLHDYGRAEMLRHREKGGPASPTPLPSADDLDRITSAYQFVEALNRNRDLKTRELARLAPGSDDRRAMEHYVNEQRLLPYHCYGDARRLFGGIRGILEHDVRGACHIMDDYSPAQSDLELYLRVRREAPKAAVLQAVRVAAPDQPPTTAETSAPARPQDRTPRSAFLARAAAWLARS